MTILTSVNCLLFDAIKNLFVVFDWTERFYFSPDSCGLHLLILVEWWSIISVNHFPFIQYWMGQNQYDHLTSVLLSLPKLTEVDLGRTFRSVCLSWALLKNEWSQSVQTWYKDLQVTWFWGWKLERSKVKVRFRVNSNTACVRTLWVPSSLPAGQYDLNLFFPS